MIIDLRQDEREVLGHLVATWNAYCKIDDQRDDGAEFAWLIHRLQDLIAARPTYRLLDREIAPALASHEEKRVGYEQTIGPSMIPPVPEKD